MTRRKTAKHSWRVKLPGYVHDSSRRIDASVILAIATWLIFNSHTEAFHPHPWMAADGMLGNALFYFISGFGIQSSLSARAQGLFEFSARRLERIYVPLCLVGLLYWLTLHRGEEHSLWELFRTYIYPTNYTYIKVILPCYLGLWVLNRAGAPLYYLSAGVAVSCMIAGYILDSASPHASGKLVLGNLPELLWDAFFWILVVSGAAFARWKVEAMLSLHRILLLGALFAAYLALKFVLLVEETVTALYPVLFVLVWAMCCLSLATLGSPSWVKRVMQTPLIGAFLGLSSALTLEIYLVHEPLVHLGAIYGLPYPLNLAALLALTLPIAFVVSVTADLIQRRIRSAPKPPAQGR